MDSKLKATGAVAIGDVTAGDIFDCLLCGDCCTGFGGTYLTQDNIKNIAAYIGSDPAAFVDNYCDLSGAKPVITRGKNGSCIFFDPEKQCIIHPVKPYMCRAWPFLKTLVNNPENWDIMANSCPGMEKGIPHKDIQRIAAAEKEKLDRLVK